MLGFVFGLTGIRDGRPIHWSHMLGVRPEARGRGIGRMLKEHQRKLLRERGVPTIFWTFDPLAVGNAHLNLNLLGARVVEYVADMYPPTGSPLHGTVPTDRFVVAWETDASRRPVASLPQAEAKIEVFTPAGEVLTTPSVAIDGDSPAVMRIELPTAFGSLLERDPAEAGKWRMAVRRGLMAALNAGYTVAGITTDSVDSRPYYVLTRATGAEARREGSNPVAESVGAR
jgi:predicted GNAT superfamily acetyltransferase